MAFLIGAVLALSVGLFVRFTGLDRDRAFNPTVMIVIASYYALFAVLGNSAHALANESIAIALFVTASIAGFRTSLWLVVATLAAHGLFDFVHGYLIVYPGVSVWWPSFCLSYDIVAAAYLVWLLSRSKARANAA